MVENAENSADTIAKNLLRDIKGEGEKEKYAPKFHGTMVSVGGRYGVAHVGLPGKFFALPSFLAMFAKHFINVIYFIQVLGWNKVFSYLRHEFFTIRDSRSFLGGHFSNRSPSFMLVPLRVYLGCYWLYEGIMKILEGWFKTPSLTGFFTGANQFYENIINSASGIVTDAAASATTEAVASATGEAAASAGKLIFKFDMFNLIRLILVESGEYAFKIQVGLVDIFMNNVVLPSDGMQMFFQITIVLAEVLIGLALIGGLFTTPAAAVSLLLQGMFLTSTGLYMSTWWMLFAGIAMLFSGGRALSLDYYVMPQLKKKWRALRFVRKGYLYND
jgi:NADH dehydrogenase